MAEMSPRGTARLAGGLFLLVMVLGGFAQSTAGRLVLPGDAAATARNLLADGSLFRLVYAAYIVELACQIAMTVLLYRLLKPVSRNGALLAAVLGLVGCTIKTVGRLFFLAPTLLLGGAPYLGVFNPEQLQALALLMLRLDYLAETIAMVFFGLYALLEGYLVFRSGFLPRILGVVGMAGGIGWLTYLYEPLAVRLVPFILGVAVIGSLAKVGWLLVKGVDQERWRERARAAAASS